MKTQKKVLALTLTLVLAFVMTLSLAVTAFADDDTYSITIESTSTTHVYEVYQIMVGDLYDGTLSNIKWGSSVTETIKTQYSLDNLSTWLKDNDDAKAFAETIVSLLGDPVGTIDTTAGTYTLEGLAAGYYLIKDRDNSLSGENDAYTSYILKVVDDEKVTPKSDVPEVGKEVLDTNDSDKTVDTENDGWGDSADHDIGDDVSFRLTGTLPSNYGDYDEYTFIFHDKMSAGLQLNEGTFTVKAVKEGAKDIAIDKEYYEVKYPAECGGECTFDVVFEDLKAIEDLAAGYTIVVEYTAKLTGDAVVIGNPGNPNEVYLEFSNNPNPEGDGKNETGKTPPKDVVVFTYELDVTKVGEDEETPLDGAEFTLEKFIEDATGTYDEQIEKTGRWVAVDKKEGTAGSKFEFVGLDDGHYRLTETKAPNGYNKLDKPIYFEVKADHTKDGTDIADGKLVELKFTVASDEGHIATDIVNKTGSNLPSTGGIGTTIFYIIGGLLVAVTSVLLITKSRMKGKN